MSPLHQHDEGEHEVEDRNDVNEGGAGVIDVGVVRDLSESRSHTRFVKSTVS